MICSEMGSQACPTGAIPIDLLVVEAGGQFLLQLILKFHLNFNFNFQSKM